MNDSLYTKKIISFIAEYLSVHEKSLSPDTKLSCDLGLDGDDSDEFMQDFAKHFKVDLSSFVFTKYFGVEGGFNPFIYIFYKVFITNSLNLKEITLYDLAKAASIGKWID